jgi:ATP-binding cassette ChvD family protein
MLVCNALKPRTLSLLRANKNNFFFNNQAIYYSNQTRVKSVSKNPAPVKPGRNKYAHLTESNENVRGGMDAARLQEQHKENQQQKGTVKKKPGYGDPSKLVFIMRDIGKTLQDNTVLFEGVNLSCFSGAKIGVLGLNGCGKSSLMKIIAGVDEDYEGEIEFPQKPKIGYLAQEPELDEEKDVKGNILDGVPDKAEKLHEYYRLKELVESEDFDAEDQAHILEQYEELAEEVEEEKLTDLEWQIERAMNALRCPPAHSDVSKLSGGERRRVALVRLLISAPDILLLDEPTNHLDAESVAWLEHFLFRYKGSVIAITHDRYFLDNVAGWILEVEGGRCIPFEGNYSSWLLSKQMRLNMEKKREKVLKKHLEEELEWIKKSPKGRQAKSKARIGKYEELRDQQKNREYEPGTIVIPAGARLGAETITLKNISKSIPASENDGVDRLLINNFNFALGRGDIVGIVGPNGVGKTTLLKMIAGEEKPDQGEVKIGNTVRIGYASQSRGKLNPYNTVYDEIAGTQNEIQMGDKMVSMRTYVAAFQFTGGAQQKYVSDLSGGERNRVHLAKMLTEDANILLLDEPTNDIDIEVLRSLENGLMDYPGCAIIVSHDRWFLDRVVTHIIAFEGEGRVVSFVGNYSEYEQDRKSRSAAEGKSSKFTFTNIFKSGQSAKF